MPSAPRLQAIQTILQRPATPVDAPATLDELWACNVFSLEAMKSALPKAVFKSIQRSIREGSKLDSSVADVVAQAMKDWATSRGALDYAHVFSPLTGAQAVADQAGWTRVDQSTGKDLFPRTDAAVIALVTDQHDRIVLGSNALWESRRYSLLAGFVEPGESLEAAVVREVFEESGLIVTNPRYMGSQPWPFPASLMVGFHAEIDESSLGDIRPDGTEIIDLRWFSRAELLASVGDVLLPGRPSIARAMIEDWLGQELPEGT